MEYKQYVSELDRILRPDDSYDIIRRELVLRDGTRAVYWCIDGLVDSDVMERVLEFIYSSDAPGLLASTTPYIEVDTQSDPASAATKVLSGVTALAAEGLGEMVMIYARHYPSRSIDEPENEKSLRGPRDGFCEKIVPNTALIRRRIRDPALTIERVSLGKMTVTDTAVVYIKGKVNEKLLAAVKKKLAAFDGPTLSFGEQSLAEYLVQTRWYNPFPKVRYTERPDSAAAMVLEGSIILVCDNTPSVMILPTSIFDFLQEANDFYLPPLTATYLRLTRLLISVVTVFLIPLWYLLISNPSFIPPGMRFIGVALPGAVPVFWQIILVELIIDGLKIASLNTPSSLGNSLSVVMGLILGELAVDIGWFVPEVILYMAFIAIANFAQPSYELGYALKFMRILLLALTAVFNIWGFVAGVLAVGLLIVSNATVDGSRSYLYPLIPWNTQAMKRFFVRARLKYPRRSGKRQ